MKKVALLFVLAVFVPSLVLAWLAVRSLRDQQYVLERQQTLLCQGIADRLSGDAGNFLLERQREFGQRVEALLTNRFPADLALRFDDELRRSWPLADLGFAVTVAGKLVCPSPASRPEAMTFCLANGAFLANRESVEVYWNTPKGAINLTPAVNRVPSPTDPSTGSSAPGDSNPAVQTEQQLKNAYVLKSGQRVVMPQQQALVQPQQAPAAEPVSKVASAEAEFWQLIGDSPAGTLARFLDNRLKVMFWYRPPRDPQLVFGAQLDLRHLTEELRPLIQLDAPVRDEFVAALLDDAARPVAVSHADFRPDSWKRPFVATEIGEALPHWEVAVYLLNPARLHETARSLSFTLGLIVLLLVLAIGVGGWLIVADLRRQLALARQKTDFVSNVSHELKTPLTSIRMFSELLAEGRVTDAARQRGYLQIITAETARLTRLINNVLDFARLERGEKKYHLAPCDLAALVTDTVETYRPHLEQAGFQVAFECPAAALRVNGDRDALAQVLVNLLSNAEKYSGERKEIRVELQGVAEPVAHAEVRVLDRGPGVPAGCGGRIFEQFYRAHDSLASGIPGSGLGLTLARQIARAHGGDVVYAPRDGGGGCFSLRVPVLPS